MTIDKIKKRDGRIVDFDPEKIQQAVTKAFIATGTEVRESELDKFTSEAVSMLAEEFKDRIPGVEDAQDTVERLLANKGYFDVAKHYILYRTEHAKIREEKKKEVVEKVNRSEFVVKKRDGSTARFDLAQVKKAIMNVAGRFPNLDVDIEGILSDFKTGMYDGISTKEINQVVLMAIKARIERDPAYSKMAARFLINDLYKDVLGVDEFEDVFKTKYKEVFIGNIKAGVEDKRLDARMLDFDLERIASSLALERDFEFEYLGAQTLYDRYFLRDHKQQLLETPQAFWMRVAMGLSIEENDKEVRAIEFYNLMSELRYVPSTPTLLHSGTEKPQMSSCYLSTVKDDLHNIFKCIGDNAQLSKWSGGIGQDWTDIRATNALVQSINVPSQGLIPFLKIVDSTTAAINRSGKRRGATCVFLETWHLDIESFLELRKNTGDDRRRTHDTNTSNWIPDLFMKRVAENGEWTLFSPEETPDLHHIYGKKFEERYKEYEKMADRGEINLWKRVNAMDLWQKMITMLYETGHPWITFKDPSNIRSPQDHVGVVHSSNLCTEITLNTSEDETAVCNLGSINLYRHTENGKVNWDKMAESVSRAMRMLDNVINLNFYPTPEAENSNLKHRPVGLGIMGFQNVLYELGMQFESEDAVELSDELMEFVSYHSILSSSKLAKERGAYESYKGSKWDRGLFPIDTIDILEEERGEPIEIDRNSRLDWTPVREHVKKHGMRNSNCMAIAPTATNANINGCLPSIEPIYKNLYVKSNFSGDFTVINKNLVAELKELGLWTPDLLEKLKYYEGSVQNISEIPEELRAKYKEVFEIDPHWIVRHAAKRTKWIDQSQSVNIFTSSESGKFISDIYFDAWRSGMKTTYYLRTLGASAIEKSTIDINKKYDVAPSEPEAIPETEAVLAKANTLTGKLEKAVEESKEPKKPGVMSSSQVISIAEDGLCDSCQ